MSIDPALATSAAAPWVHRTGVVSLDRPRVMAVVNLTPDSFFDGGLLVAEGTDAPNVSVALRRCRQLVALGADILDLGGESTRPGADPIPAARQLRRVLPVVERLGAADEGPRVPISVDTRDAAVAQALLGAGASIVNDVSGLGDPAMADVLAGTGAGVVIGHLRGEPRTMNREIRFDDVVAEVAEELTKAVERAVAAGVQRCRIVVDPGIGFGKTAEQSAALVAASALLQRQTGCPVLVGASRKSFLGALVTGDAGDRLVASVAAALVAVDHGASIVRVHDVGETVQALAVARGIADAWRRHGRPRRSEEDAA